MPYSFANKVYSGQIIGSSSSAASNYRAACRGKSKEDFIYKLKIVEEELDETLFFYEMLAEFNSSFRLELREMFKECNELLSIIVSSINTASKKIPNSKSKIKYLFCVYCSICKTFKKRNNIADLFF
jgi:four helix bundle protein